MPRSLGKIRVMIASSALFDMREETTIWKEDPQKYDQYMYENQDVPCKPGAVFGLVQNMFDMNKKLKPFLGEDLFEILIVTKNAVTSSGLRTEKSLLHYKFPQEAVFYYGGAPISINDHRAFETDLLLTTDYKDAQTAVDHDIAAAVMEPKRGDYETMSGRVKFWFDFDAVVSGGSAEAVFQEKGLDFYKKHEKKHANVPLEIGPFGSFLKKLSLIAKDFEGLSKEFNEQSIFRPIELSILTARGTDARLRAMNTLTELGIHIHKTRMLSGASKAPWLRENLPAIFFDDQPVHLKEGSIYVPCGHVFYPTGTPMHKIWQKRQEEKHAKEQKQDTAKKTTKKVTKKTTKKTTNKRAPS